MINDAKNETGYNLEGLVDHENVPAKVVNGAKNTLFH